jgi:hypothetical protein
MRCLSRLPPPSSHAPTTTTITRISLGTPLVTLPSLQTGRRIAAAAAARLGLQGALVADSVPHLVSLAVHYGTNGTAHGEVQAALLARRGVLEWSRESVLDLPVTTAVQRDAGAGPPEEYAMLAAGRTQQDVAAIREAHDQVRCVREGTGGRGEGAGGGAEFGEAKLHAVLHSVSAARSGH